jgi:hypothetical protein
MPGGCVVAGARMAARRVMDERKARQLYVEKRTHVHPIRSHIPPCKGVPSPNNFGRHFRGGKAWAAPARVPMERLTRKPGRGPTWRAVRRAQGTWPHRSITVMAHRWQADTPTAQRVPGLSPGTRRRWGRSPLRRAARGTQLRWASGVTVRAVAPVKSWRGRPILYSGSPIISFSCAIQPTVRASAKTAVNSGTGMPIARCTMPE